MIIRMIDSGEIVEVEDSWGERLYEHGKAEPVSLKSGKPKAEVTVTDKVPEPANAEEEAKAEPAKKAGKKR
jgi:hypothetical protein